MAWGVERPDSSTAQRIARRVELEPSSLHLMVGGIGSGKSTELWRIHQQLGDNSHESGDVSHYIDVAEQTSINGLDRGALVALAGVRLVRYEEKVRHARVVHRLHRQSSVRSRRSMNWRQGRGSGPCTMAHRSATRSSDIEKTFVATMCSTRLSLPCNRFSRPSSATMATACSSSTPWTASTTSVDSRIHFATTWSRSRKRASEPWSWDRCG